MCELTYDYDNGRFFKRNGRSDKSNWLIREKQSELFEEKEKIPF
jgi:hypothetical protein